MGRLCSRAVIVTLLLLTIGGGIANADSRFGPGNGAGASWLPDDPGYDLSP
ncbi:MAG TPA: hypothetical protein VFC31_15410 [Candidatus Limnocylindria bacterium]|nr:hypothetical protein [Candidatus Limnocylindria bacterium]